MSIITNGMVVPSSNGQTTHPAYCWKPEQGKIRGVVQIVHDLGEYAWRYHPLGAFLALQGYAVYCMDLPGHGKRAQEENRLGYLSRSDGSSLLLRDLQEFTKFIKRDCPGHPITLFGEGFGALCACQLMTMDPLSYAGVALSGPYARTMAESVHLHIARRGVKKHGPSGYSDYLEKLAGMFYTPPVKPPRTSFDWFSSVEEEVDAYQNDPLCGFRLSCSLYVDFYTLLLRVSKKSWLSEVPVNMQLLILSGMQDPVGDFGREAQRLYHALRKSRHPKVTMKTYYQGRHSLFRDVCRDQAAADLLEWLNSSLPY